WCMLILLCLVFFFQAEDGIRDRTVTGVQTCALPISTGRSTELAMSPKSPGNGEIEGAIFGALRTHRQFRGPPGSRPDGAHGKLRSEERRVGKEWRAQRV